MTSFSPDRRRSSPNFGPRAPGSPIDHIVLHYTGMRSDAAAIDWLCNPRSQVSSHYVVTEEGDVLALVAESERAWHAGRSVWRGVSDINSRSIGIEIGNPGHAYGYRPFPDRQIEAVIALCRDIGRRHPISPRNVVGHSDIAPDRKDDPGELFPWSRLAGRGIGLWCPAAPISHGPSLGSGDRGEAVAAAQALLAAIGYGQPVTGEIDPGTAAVLRAFQRRFRPSHIDGRLDGSTRETLRRVADLMASAPEG